MGDWEQYGIAGVLAAVLFVVAQIGLAWLKSRKTNGNGGDFLIDGRSRDQCTREIYLMLKRLDEIHNPRLQGSVLFIQAEQLDLAQRTLAAITATEQSSVAIVAEQSSVAIVAQFERTTERVNRLLDLLERRGTP